MPFRSRHLFPFLLLIAILSLSVCAVSDKKESPDHYQALFGRYTRSFSPPVPEKAKFAGEEVPLQVYYVKEALDREILAATFMHSSSILFFKRAYRWFPVIEPILAKNGIPDDFKFLAVAESNLANAVSPAKAEGYWQFLASTGKQYGLEVNEFVDERYHMEKATEAACRYFKAAYAKFGQWSLVAAAYNRGSEGLDRAISSQQASGYFDLYLNEETSRYVYRIIALKEIYLNPVKYGFYLRESDLYPPLRTRDVKVDSSIADLPGFARGLSIHYRLLRELNPWIQQYSLPNKQHKTYVFKVPADGNAMTVKGMFPSENSATFFNDSLRINELQ